MQDLKASHDSNPGCFADRELHLLRDLSKGRGVGFFDAGNLHFDSIVWLIEDNRQRVAFVDPKGIHNVGLNDSKVSFIKTIKEIEQRLGDVTTVLDCFIFSNTISHVIQELSGIGKSEMARRHILFQDEEKACYIEKPLERATGSGA